MQSSKKFQNSPGLASKGLSFAFFGYDYFDAPTNMAIDETLKKLSEQTGLAFIRFYSFSKPAIILSISDSIKCLKQGYGSSNDIEVTRRQSGGKPIYVDENVLAYSISGPTSTSQTKDFGSMDFVHRYFGSRASLAIAKYSGSDNIETGEVYSIKAMGKPLAGHAQNPTIGKSFFYHGVIAMRAWNFERINRLLRMRPGDYDELKILPSVESISAETRGTFDLEHAKSDLAKELLAQISEGNYQGMGDEEKKKVLDSARMLADSKYRNEEWIKNGNGGTLREDSAFCLLYTG
ncbi:MAG: lipoate--protein ligase family protein [Candidatus Micrarchaeia archaeon]